MDKPLDELKEPQENYVSGWVRIYRSMLSHWLWKDKPYTKAQAFIWMLLKANHKPQKVLIGNQLFVCNRGEIITSQLKLADTFGWNKNTVHDFLTLLSDDKMLSYESTTQFTKLIIANYSIYQDFDLSAKPPKGNESGNEKETKGKRGGTNNNDNNIIIKEMSEPPDLVFDRFRKLYGGTKRGNDTEFENFKRHKDWKEVLPLLEPSVLAQTQNRKDVAARGGFVPEWKNLKTWINNRCWEEDVAQAPAQDNSKLKIKPKEYYELFTKE